jgi:hypothetical protein
MRRLKRTMMRRGIAHLIAIRSVKRLVTCTGIGGLEAESVSDAGCSIW